jgi:sirohydrochlorin ferrochelatase
VPYLLQLGGHVAEDLPKIIAAARARHPGVPIDLAAHLGYDPLLVHVIADRVGDTVREQAELQETLCLGLPVYSGRRTVNVLPIPS